MMQQYNAKVFMEKMSRVQCSGDSDGAIRNSVSLLSAASLLAIVRGLLSPIWVLLCKHAQA